MTQGPPMTIRERLAFARESLAQVEQALMDVREEERRARIWSLDALYASPDYQALRNDRERGHSQDTWLLGDEQYQATLTRVRNLEAAQRGCRVQMEHAEDAWREYTYGVLDRLAGSGRLTDRAAEAALR
jgi:hypothetical protein